MRIRPSHIPHSSSCRRLIVKTTVTAMATGGWDQVWTWNKRKSSAINDDCENIRVVAFSVDNSKRALFALFLG